MALQMVADRNNIYIFPWYIADLSVTSDIKQITGLAISQIFMTVKDGFMTASYDVASVDRVGRATLDKLITDPSFFDQVIQNIYTYSAQLEAFFVKKIYYTNYLIRLIFISWKITISRQN
jgi:hypothetical protein